MITGKEIFQLLVDGHDAANVVEEWESRGYEFDLRIRRAKTKGKIVVELTDPIFASRLVQWYHAQAHIKNGAV